MSSPIAINATLPPNVVGTVIVPTPSLSAPVISEGGVDVWRNGAFVPGRAGVTAAQRLPSGAIALSVGSGAFSFATSSASPAAASASACVPPGVDLELACPLGAVIGYVTRAGLGPQRRHRFLLTHVLERLCLSREVCRVEWSSLASEALPADLSVGAGAGAEVCAAAACVAPR